MDDMQATFKKFMEANKPKKDKDKDVDKHKNPLYTKVSIVKAAQSLTAI